MTDKGLKELAGLKSLTSLDLYGTQVTDAGLKELAGLSSLQTLNLGGTKVTDAGLKELAGLKNLATLYLPNGLTDAGLRSLREFGLLHTLPESLGKQGTPNSAEEVISLNLSGTSVTDAGLKEMAGPKNLSSLSLVKMQVTDSGLNELTGLKYLSSLDLRTRVTDKGVAELRKALPNCFIDHFAQKKR